MADFNRRFAVQPAVATDAHVPYRGATEALQRILSVQEERRLSKNLSCQYEKQHLQIKTESVGLSLRGAKVTVHSHTDGRMELLWQGRALAFEKSVKLPMQEVPIDGKDVNARVDSALKKRACSIPSKNHPWKRVNDGAFDNTPVTAQFKQPKGSIIAEAGAT
jgi:hypothetical protein